MRARVAFLVAVVVATSSSVVSADGWDFTYGSPGPADYSEYTDTFATDDGGAILTGQFFGNFEGLSTTVSYQPFVQYRDAEGVVVWTLNPYDRVDNTLGAGLCAGDGAAIDSDDVVYVISGCLLYSANSSGIIDAKLVPLNFYRFTSDIGGTFQAGRSGGLYVLASCEYQDPDLPPVAPDCGRVRLIHINSALSQDWTTTLPDEFGFDSGAWYSTVAAAAPLGKSWVFDVVPAPLPHLNESIAMVRLDASGQIEATIKFYEFGMCGVGYVSLEPKRVTDESIWLLTCSSAQGDTSPSLYSFSAVDGHLIGRVPLPEGVDPKTVWFSEDGSLAFMQSGNQLEVWTIEGDGSDTTWDRVDTITTSDSTTIADGDAIGGDYVVVGSTDPNSTSLLDTPAKLTESSRLTEAGTSRAAFITRRTTIKMRSVVPARLLETRSGPKETTVDGQFQGIGRQGAGTTLQLKVTSRGGVPADAAAVMLNVTAVSPSAPGFLTVFPCGSALPKASNVNYVAGDVVPNAVLAKIGTGGKVCIYTLAGTDIVVDVNGYVPAGGSPSSVVPARLLETRSGPKETTVDGQFQGIGRQGAGKTLQLKVTGRGGVPADADAVMLNVTAVFPEAPGFLTVFPCGSALPKASNVNYVAGDVVPNAVLAKIGTGGKVCIYTLAATDIVVDVNGYVPAGASPSSVVPARLLETRSGPNESTVDGQFQGIGRQGAGTTLELQVTGRGGVPASPGAVMLNVTAVFPSAPGFLTVFPCGSALPKASNVNYVAGDVVPNAVLAKIGTGGKVCIYTLAATDIVVDVNGYVP